jgi:hypothetical protein
MNKKTMDAIFAQFKEEYQEPIKEEPCKCQHNFMDDGGLFICGICSVIQYGITDPYVEYHDRPQSPSSPYEKLTHFKEKLDELSCANSALIPDEIMNLCEGVTGQEQIKTILQVNKLKKYYTSVYLIMKQKGVVIPPLLQHEKEKLIRLFKQIEIIYNRIKRKTNMVSYNFLLSRMLPMIGRSDLVPFLFILHSKRKQKEYSIMWCKMLTLL